MNADRQKTLMYLLALRKAKRELQRLDTIVADVRRTERRMGRASEAQLKAQGTIKEIQDILNCGRTNTQTIEAVRELVTAMGAPLREDPRRKRDEVFP